MVVGGEIVKIPFEFFVPLFFAVAFLASPEGQAAYGKFGFVGASAQALTLKPIP